MRDPFENIPAENAMEAARRGARPALRRRFYGKAATAAVAGAGGYAVRLDDKPVRTPRAAFSRRQRWRSRRRSPRNGKRSAT